MPDTQIEQTEDKDRPRPAPLRQGLDASTPPSTIHAMCVRGNCTSLALLFTLFMTSPHAVTGKASSSHPRANSSLSPNNTTHCPPHTLSARHLTHGLTHPRDSMHSASRLCFMEEKLLTPSSLGRPESELVSFCYSLERSLLQSIIRRAHSSVIEG